MDDDNLDSGFLNISLSDSEDDGSDSSSRSPVDTTTCKPDEPVSRADRRNALSESDFQLLRQSYRPKVENGDIYRTIKIPLDPAGAKSKPVNQELLHAVEELYFFRRYEEAVNFVHDVLMSEGEGGAGLLEEDTTKLLRYYQAKCSQRLLQARARGARGPVDGAGS
ncbi:hypothetical protein B0T22DRAFT_466493 [Podospora appendiculata]|uniref:Uncharacterized protein n=1 Tax=Podospora appendiculata TaxID=314037 RepID=A0AAE1CAQ8_9PEZI|nr:hypothetical protein B0T22DRAFT_466493 [Podospora appendiculata]